MAVRYFALLMGVAFMLAGVGGFIPGITQPAHTDMPSMTLSTNYGLLLGLFPINLAHNLVHLSLGIWGLAAFRRYEAARTFSKGLVVTLTALTIMGLLPTLNTAFGFLPLFGHDIWLHALEAAVAFYFGFIYRERKYEYQ